MRVKVTRANWINTIVGILNSAFSLTEEEKYQIMSITQRLLQALNIPDRDTPDKLPAAVALESRSGFYSLNLHQVNSNQNPEMRHVTQNDIVVSIESWRDALMDLLITAYPDLTIEERIITAKILTEILSALGLPDRAAVFFPQEVVKAFQDSPESLY